MNTISTRTKKTRSTGLTMMMDKGLSFRQAEDFVSSSTEFTDIVKLGFGTALITPNLKEKVNLYKENNILVYPGGTLFELFQAKKEIDKYKKFLHKNGFETVEISDGSIDIEHEKKCNLIQDFAKEFKVISEVGSKNITARTNSSEWIESMKNELDSGSWKVIAEAREAGNTGIFNSNGSIKSELVNTITNNINPDDIIWEAPKKDQQVWFINRFGSNVNLGNISNNDIISLECMRTGLRSDTFNHFLI